MNQKEPTDKVDELNLLDLWRMLIRRWKMITVLFLASIFGALIICWLLPKTYQAQTTVIPLEAPQGGIASTLNAIGGLTGISLGESTPAEKLVAVLQSRTVTESIISRLNLLPELFPPLSFPISLLPFLRPQPTLESGVRKMQLDVTEIAVDTKSNLISIAVEHRKPERAAQIANAYIEELDKFMNANALTLAKKKRILIEQQIADAKEKMRSAEDKLRGYQEDKRLLAPDLQAEAAIKGLSDLKAEIISKEVQLGVVVFPQWCNFR
jgi:uncharacterized protein involved in exopolysaccharide biosynthesis